MNRREMLKASALVGGTVVVAGPTAVERELGAVPAIPGANRAAGAQQHAGTVRDLRFDDGWTFRRGEAPGADALSYDDASWRRLDLPHDWSIEDLPPHPETTGESALWASGSAPLRVGPFDRYASLGQGDTGWVVGGTGWYRKRFSLAGHPLDRHFEIRFDGVYMDADVWLNGRHLGSHPYGYTGFGFDVTPHIRRDGENVLAVRVRNEGRNSRWYSGSGLYRHVWLTVTGPVRVPVWGLGVTTREASIETARLEVSTRLENRTPVDQEVTVLVRVRNADGVEVASDEAVQHVQSGRTEDVRRTLEVVQPRLWSPETPELYRAEVTLVVGGEEADRTETSFGIRSLTVDARQGLRINEKPVKLRGGCLHHDNGILGSVALDRAEERRVELMKANGFNAIRCAHNPPSPAFLDACDRLGMLVIDEAFDMWEAPKRPDDYHRFFSAWWEKDLEGMVLRDRNHPSVILWSIGNEVPERANPEGIEIARRLVETVKRLDSSRPVTAALCVFWDSDPPFSRPWSDTDPAYALLDVGGYNYVWTEYEADHARVPERVVLGTESFPGQAFESWQLVERHPYVIGDFVWTAMDYLGEAAIGHSVLADPDETNARSPSYPWFNAWCGDIDLIGEKKAQSYFRDVLWGRSVVEMAVQRPVPAGLVERISRWGWSDELRSWTWPGREGQSLVVRVYSAAGEVRLLLNGQEIGVKAASRETGLRAEFEVPYAPGELRAVALENGREVGSTVLSTVGPPAKLRLVPDRTQIAGDRNDLVFVMVEVVDDAGHPVPDAAVDVAFAVSGVGELAAVGSADPKRVSSFRRPRCRTFHGRCLLILRPTGESGEMAARAEAEGLSPADVAIGVTAPAG